MDVALRVASSKQTVIVEADASILNTQTFDVGGIASTDEIARAYPSLPQRWMDDRTRALATFFLLKEKLLICS